MILRQPIILGQKIDIKQNKIYPVLLLCVIFEILDPIGCYASSCVVRSTWHHLAFIWLHITSYLLHLQVTSRSPKQMTNHTWHGDTSQAKKSEHKQSTEQFIGANPGFGAPASSEGSRKGCQHWEEIHIPRTFERESHRISRICRKEETQILVRPVTSPISDLSEGIWLVMKSLCHWEVWNWKVKLNQRTFYPILSRQFPSQSLVVDRELSWAPHWTSGVRTGVACVLR